MRDKTRIALLLVLISLSVGLVSCADDGRELAKPADWQTTTTRPPPPTSALTQETSSSGATLSSPDFEPGDMIPLSATCGGDNLFPNLDWANIPGGTGELAITLVDQTDPAEPLLLWLMAGIDPGRNGLQSGFLPEGAYETLNDYGNPGYGTPCLDGFASGLRDLQFRLYILPGDAGLQSGDPGNEAWDSLRAQATETASLLARIEN